MFQVYDKDTIGKDDGIGEIQIPLWLVDLDIETDNTMELSPVTKGKDNKPVLVARYWSWKYHPYSSILPPQAPPW